MKPTKLLAVLEHQEFPKALPMYVIIPKNKVKNYATKKFSKANFASLQTAWYKSRITIKLIHLLTRTKVKN